MRGRCSLGGRVWGWWSWRGLFYGIRLRMLDQGDAADSGSDFELAVGGGRGKWRWQLVSLVAQDDPVSIDRYVEHADEIHA